jgi:hypothetical protein
MSDIVTMPVREMLEFYRSITTDSDGCQDVTAYNVTFIMPAQNGASIIAEIWNMDSNGTVESIYARIQLSDYYVEMEV